MATFIVISAVIIFLLIVASVIHGAIQNAKTIKRLGTILKSEGTNKQ